MMVYTVHSATYTGRSHRQAGTPCQDKVAHYQDETMSIVALADGAGSRPYSHIGAELTTQITCDFLSNRFDWCWQEADTTVAQALIQSCLSALAATAYNPEDMACTLLGYACHKDGRHIAFHLGDGVIISNNNSTIATLSPPENGFHQNETIFVTSSHSANHLRIQRRMATQSGGVLLMSDGLGESLYHHQSSLPAPACKRIFQWMQTQKDIPLDSVLVHHMETLFSKQTGDDLSVIAVAWQ